MTNIYFYTKGQLSRIVGILATHPGDARKRVAAASVEIFILKENHFPPRYRADWNWIREEITKFGPVYNYKGEVQEGSVEHTMSRVRNSTAANVARKIYYLHCEAEAGVGERFSDWSYPNAA